MARSRAGVLDAANDQFDIGTSSLDATGALVDEYRVEFHTVAAPHQFSAQGQSKIPMPQRRAAVQFSSPRQERRSMSPCTIQEPSVRTIRFS